MIKKSQASLEFIGEPIAEKLILGDKVIKGLDDHSTVFPSPDVTFTLLQARQDDLRSKATAAAGGNHAAVQLMYESEKLWDADFKADALYVTIVAHGVEATVLMSGYNSTVTETKPTEKSGPLTGLKAVSGSAGHLNIEFDPMHHVNSFTILVYLKGSPFAYSVINNQLVITNATGLMAIKTDTHRKIAFEGLTPRTDAVVIGFATNNAGMGAVTVFPDVFVL